jgi:HEXXH motif-containing protein
MTAEVATREYADLCRGLASPHEGLVDEFADTIAIGFARHALRVFLDTHPLCQAGDGLVDTLERWIETPTDFGTVWHPSIGLLGNAVTGRARMTPEETAARLGLRLAERGHPGRWSVRFDRPQALIFDRWLLPEIDELRVESDGDGAVVTGLAAGSPTVTDFLRMDGAWNPRSASDLIAEPQPRRVTLLLAQAMRAPELEFLRDDVIAEPAWADAPDLYRHAAALLLDCAPGYAEWVDRSISQIVPLRGAAGTINSGSSQDAPGMTHLSFGGDPMALAEMLVHEGTHQYFYLATRLGPIDDGSDPTLYYSPVKRCGRPIHFITLAYHAFANVMLFYRECQDRGFDTPEGYVRRNVDELVPQLRQLQDALETTKALTVVGRSLWEPLAERLRI